MYSLSPLLVSAVCVDTFLYMWVKTCYNYIILFCWYHDILGLSTWYYTRYSVHFHLQHEMSASGKGVLCASHPDLQFLRHAVRSFVVCGVLWYDELWRNAPEHFVEMKRYMFGGMHTSREWASQHLQEIWSLFLLSKQWSAPCHCSLIFCLPSVHSRCVGTGKPSRRPVCSWLLLHRCFLCEIPGGSRGKGCTHQVQQTALTYHRN